MALFDYGDSSFDISEWWDNNGEYHQGAPTEYQLEHEASELTGHITWEDGHERYFDMYSHDGWLYEELEVEYEDAADYYEP